MLKSFCRTEHDESSVPSDLKPTVTKSGRKIKGRGTMVGSLSRVDASLVSQADMSESTRVEGLYSLRKKLFIPWQSM